FRGFLCSDCGVVLLRLREITFLVSLFCRLRRSLCAGETSKQQQRGGSSGSSQLWHGHPATIPNEKFANGTHESGEQCPMKFLQRNSRLARLEILTRECTQTALIDICQAFALCT